MKRKCTPYMFVYGYRPYNDDSVMLQANYYAMFKDELPTYTEMKNTIKQIGAAVGYEVVILNMFKLGYSDDQQNFV